jgi:hypothetical protein
MMRIRLSCIQPHPHGAILRYFLSMVNLFLCSSTNYFKNQLLERIIVRNLGDDEEDKPNIMRVLERKEMHTSRWRSYPIQNRKVYHTIGRAHDRSCGPLLLGFVAFIESDSGRGRASVGGEAVVHGGWWWSQGSTGDGARRRGCRRYASRQISAGGGGSAKYQVRVRGRVGGFTAGDCRGGWGGGSGDTSIRRWQGGVVRRLAGMEGAELADMAEAEVGGG